MSSTTAADEVAEMGTVELVRFGAAVVRELERRVTGPAYEQAIRQAEAGLIEDHEFHRSSWSRPDGLTVGYERERSP